MINIQQLSFEQIITSTLIFLEKETLFFLMLLPVFFLMNLFFKKKRPALYLNIWLILLFRLILPPSFNYYISAGDLMRNLFPAGFEDASNINNNSTSFTEFEDIIFLSETERVFNYANVLNAANFSVISHLNKKSKIIIFGIWLLTVFVLLILFLKQLIGFYKTGRYEINDAKIISHLKILKKRYKIKTPIKLYSTTRNISPFTIGLFKSKIIIPVSLLSIKNRDEAIITIFAHELAHIKRHDSFWLCFQNLLQIVYFFNPAIWLINREINKTREVVCDNEAMFSGKIAVKKYAKNLIELVKINTSGRRYNMSALGIGISKNEIKFRLVRMKNTSKMKGKGKMRFLTTILIGLLFIPIQQANSQQAEMGKKDDKVITKKENKTNDASKNNKIPILSSSQKSILKEMNFIFPVPGYKITSGFGMRMHPIIKELKFHKGVDIPAPKGINVVTSADGVVYKTGDRGKNGSGKYIIIKHENNITTFYSQLSGFKVKKGDNVIKGQIIALVGSSGVSTGPHLHFEIRINKKNADPSEYLVINN